MAKQNYSIWFNQILENNEAQKQRKHKAELKRRANERARIARENALREEQIKSIETDRQKIREKRSELRKQQNLTTSIGQITDAEKVKLKDDKKIEKLRQKQLKVEKKKADKAYKEKVKAETKKYKEYQKTLASADAEKIDNNYETLKQQRKKERKAMKIADALERTRKRQLNQELRKEEKRKEKEMEAQAVEYRRMEKLRKEQEMAAKRAEAKRRQRTGQTFIRRLEKRFRHLAKIYSFRNLRDTVNTYGYSYSLNEFAKQATGIVVVVTAVAWISEIRGVYLGFLVFASLLSVPWLLYAWFNQMFNGKKFEMVQSYLSNILPVFMQKPKIRYALEEVRDMSSGRMQIAIDHAIDYIDTSSEDKDIMRTALSFIEVEFPNSRIGAVHKLLLDVEEGNSSDYNTICENMYIDIESWIRRVYGFQKDLKSRRTSLVILCIFSLLMNCMFTYMYGTSEVFNGYTERAIYQISTSVFIFLVLLTAALILTQLHGSWLVNDSTNKEENANMEAYSYIHSHSPTTKKSDMMCAIILAFIGVVLVFGMNNRMAIILFPFALLFASKGKMTWNAKKSRVRKALMLEFPIWLRGIALNLHDMTVINAIMASKETCSYGMAREIDKFFEIYDENPTSIRAFNEFLSEYEIEDVQATMKVLFTVQSMSKEQVKIQTAMLINRNQELLTKTETIKNKDSLGFAEMLGYLPMILLTLQLLMSMGLMFMHIMEYMNNIMATGI